MNPLLAPKAEVLLSADADCRAAEAEPMQDVLFFGATIAFFLLAVAYVHGCERLK